ncbi:MAG: MBL fold metallo-hydrolase [Candidatus Zhuqueibacterota bacterium]
MKRLRQYFIGIIFGAIMLHPHFSDAAEGEVQIHYLGHSCFALEFDNGVRILCDYGESNSYGYPSPIYDIGHLYPDVVTYSHTHTDHFGRTIPYDVEHVLLMTDSLDIEGIHIASVLTSESLISVKGNGSYFFRYRDLTICHLGDAGATMANLDIEEVKNEVLSNFPMGIDLLFLTIESQENLIMAAEKFIHLIKPRRVIPMHYWTPQMRTSFFSYLQTVGQSPDKHYDIESRAEATYFLAASDTVTPIKVIGLTPAPYVPLKRPDIWYENYNLNDSGGNGNGQADAGETVQLVVTLKNISLPADQVTATLVSSDSDVVILQSTCWIGAMASGDLKSNTEEPFMVSVGVDCKTHEATFGVHITADGIFECTDQFQVVIGSATTLLVDDDCGSLYEHYYTRHLFADHWDANVRGCPALADLLGYESVIWFTGYDRETSLTAAEQTVVSEYLMAGGHLLLTGQNIGYDLCADGAPGDSLFFSNFLCSHFLSDSATATMTMGTRGHPMTNGLFVNLTGPYDCADNQNSPDVITPIAPATTILNYIPGFKCAGICAEYGAAGGRLVYLAFGFEGIAGPQENSANALLQNILAWFGTSTDVILSEDDAHRVSVCRLLQNYPNPFNARTQIRYSIAEGAPVTVTVFNILGEKLFVLVREFQFPGDYQVSLDAMHWPSGVYLYTLEAGDFIQTKKLLVLK